MFKTNTIHTFVPVLLLVVGLIVLMGLHQTASCQSNSATNAFLLSADKGYIETLDEFNLNSGGELKSKSRAILYGLAATAVPVGLGTLVEDDVGGALIAIGVAAGPSTGIAYAGDYKRAGGGLVVRASGAGITAIGTMFYIFESLEVGGSKPVGNFLMYGGLSLIGVSTLYDIFIASPKAVQRYNEQVKQNRIRLNPWVNPGDAGAGLSLQVQF